MNVVYYLMTHRNERQVGRLARRLQAGAGSFVLIHHDAKSPPLSLPAADNVHVLEHPVAVHWGRISQVLAMRRAIEWLESTRQPFDWLIYLSGQDYPIRPIREIESALLQSAVDAYCHHVPVPAVPEAGERPFPAYCRNRYFKRKIVVPGLGPRYLPRKHPYVNGFHCYAGSSWLNLSRRAVEYLWSEKKLTDRLIGYLRHVDCPDETLFHTLLLNASGLKIDNTDKRFTIWRGNADHPETLALEHLDPMCRSDAWFARKVDESTSAALLDRLDELQVTR